MISLTGLALTALLGFIIYRLFLRSDGKHYPKGPFALPLLGNALQLRGNVGEQAMQWHRKFGDIYLMYFGRDRCFVVNDLKLAKELFNDMKFSARPENELFLASTEGKLAGLLGSSGQPWSEQRRFTLRHLRDFGFGKKGGEEKIVEEVKEFLDDLATKTSQPTVINKTFQMAVLNTLWQIMAGVRYEMDDPRLWSIFNQNKKIVELFAKSPLLFFAPGIAKKLPSISGWNSVMELVNDMKEIVMGHVQHHRQTLPEDGVSRDFIDSYLKEVDSTKDRQSSFYGKTGMFNLTAVITDLFSAGFDTVTNTISFTAMYLVKNPDKQKKLQEEMDRVVGRNRFPTLADRPQLPYMEAVITEAMRMGTIAPLGLFHVATEDTKIQEYDVPKGSWLIAPLYKFHNDEAHFPNPRQYKPERFMTSDGKFQKHEAIVPFGFGKRACLGETLARDELFLFLSHLFHRFTIEAADGIDSINEDATPGIFSSPRDYNCILTERS